MGIIIIGSGIIGGILAITISRLTCGKLPVHLIETAPYKGDAHPGFDSRSLVLSRGVCQQLDYIGLWKLIKNHTTPIRSIHVSDLGYPGVTTLNAKDYRVSALGYVVELFKIGKILFYLLKKEPGVTFYCPEKVDSIMRNFSSVEVNLKKGNTIKAQLLVIANGSNSDLSHQFGISWKQKFYNHVAIITNIKTTIKHEGRAWERFTQYGPLAILPLSQNRCSLVWCYSSDKKHEISNWSDSFFCENLQRVFGWRLGRIVHSEKRVIYPLTLGFATQYISHRVVLVGNSAQTLHPVAGQGFNLGFRDIKTLSDLLVEAWSQKQDYGAYSLLYTYQENREKDKQKTIKMTDDLITLFSNRWIPLVIGRNLGLIAMEWFFPIQYNLIKRALNWMN